MKRILFVDDESKIIDGIRRMLYADRKRWDMEFVTSGEAALEACERGRFDVVISDMRMPGMDGATLLGHLQDRFPSTARIILSGYSEIALVTRAVPVAHRFLTKPCSASELQSSIERVCVLQELLSGDEIRQVIGSVGELPSLSMVYAALSQAVEDPETPIKEIVQIMEQDMAMTAKVLQLVNSAFFGLARSVTNLHTAVSLLGMETIKNLVLITETFRAFVPDKRIPLSEYESIQADAQRTACIAAKLPVDPKTRDTVVLAALLHDIGRLILASKMPAQFCSALDLSKKRDCQLFEAEEELLGTSHAEIGAYLLGLWGIPHLAIEAIAHHHRPTRIPHNDFDTSVALYVANLLARESAVEAGDLSTCELRESERACLEQLGVLHRLPEFRQTCGMVTT